MAAGGHAGGGLSHAIAAINSTEPSTLIVEATTGTVERQRVPVGNKDIEL